MIKLKIGRRVFEVAGFPEASAVYQDIRNASGEGASTFPIGRIPGHYVSYNGKVWAGSPKDWTPGKKPVFDPGSCALQVFDEASEVAPHVWESAPMESQL